MEITGFTEENINNYIELFFSQLGNASHQGDSLLNFLRSKPRICGIAHIPINLEIICSTWSNIDWTQTKTVTITVLYDRLTEWICRRYLEKQKKMSPIKTTRMDKTDVYDKCRKELAFLEKLAFLGMENNVILLGPQLLKEAQKESGCKLKDCPDLFNVGLLKSYDSNSAGIGTRIEADKHYYFVHLSLQEHFAARYLANALNNNTRDQAMKFIREHKYNRIYQLVFTFLSGLLNDDQEPKCNRPFWDALLNEPLDMFGARHMALVIQCLDETGLPQAFTESKQLLEKITQWLEYALSSGSRHLSELFQQTLRTSNTICNEPLVQQTIIRLLNNQLLTNRDMILSFISNIPLTKPIPPLLQALREALRSNDVLVRRRACNALVRMGQKGATKEVIDGLLEALRSDNTSMKSAACDALGRMGEKGATKDVIDGLLEAFRSDDDSVRGKACGALGRMGEKAATKDVIDRLLEAFRSDDDSVRERACYALVRMGEKAATKEVIDGLLEALRSDNNHVRRWACDALVRMGEKGATKDVIDGLLEALRSDNTRMKSGACDALDRMGEKGATKDVIDGLLEAFRSDDDSVRERACGALGRMGEKAATNDVIDGLLEALRSDNDSVRKRGCDALVRMGEKGATKDVIDGLLEALRGDDDSVRERACDALGCMGEKAATNDVID
ncbi:unnamed protein product, partial [Adineta ricciae]